MLFKICKDSKFVFLFVNVLVIAITVVHSSNDDDKAPATSSSPDVNCGQTQQMVNECFKDLPPHLLDFLETTKVAANPQDIAAKCKVFKRGMTCFDRYAEKCLTNEKFILFQNNVAAARKVLTKFCNDRKFQEDYLQHKECFASIRPDWKRCTDSFQHILVDELHGTGNIHPKNITTRFMQFCCARHAFENCIYNSARFKCFTKSAKFAREMAKGLSEEKHFSNCRQYENLLCAANGINVRIAFYLILALLSLFIDHFVLRQCQSY